MDAVTLRQAAEIEDPLARAVALTRLMSEDHGLATRAAAYRRHAIAEALEKHPREQVALALGVSPPRITQLRQGSVAAPEPFAEEQPTVLIQRAIPSAPTDRASASLYLAEAERQGIRAGREMLYIGREPASAHVAACLRVEEGEDVIARRKVFTANDIRVRVSTSYFREDLFVGTRLAEPEFVRPTLQAAIEDLGYRFGRAVETLRARRGTPYELGTLDIPSSEWIVEILRASYSSEDTPVHVLESICVATYHQFNVGQVAGHDEF